MGLLVLFALRCFIINGGLDIACVDVLGGLLVGCLLFVIVLLAFFVVRCLFIV